MEQGYALAAFFIIAAAIGLAMLVGAKVLGVRSKRPKGLKESTYECGEAPSGMAWVRFHARYYVVALFFVLFDIEAAFLMPWGVIVREAGRAGLFIVFSFVGVLLLGWAWALRKGALEWQ